jgi:hypothetical protein
MLTGGYATELIDHKLAYTELLFPLISGTYYHADELTLSLSLSNKSAGAKISYTVTTQLTRCEITVVFVPTLEIAKAMFKYRNSILQYNPRSYLGHEGKNVNNEIRRSIEARATNEFALFNNGITVLSDETYLNERIGQKDRAQLVLVNPQIINGGQTAYTLSIIYREHVDEPDVALLFENKEVLVKIITFQSGSELAETDKLTLIEDISRATNQQTTVTAADRRSNERGIKELQKKLFERTGLYLERKRGEFEDGLREGYIQRDDVIERTQFFRAALAIQGKINEATTKKVMTRAEYNGLVAVPDDVFDRYAFAIQLLQSLTRRSDRRQVPVTASLLIRVHFGVALGFRDGLDFRGRESAVFRLVPVLKSAWIAFQGFVGPEVFGSKRYHAVGRTVNSRFEQYLNGQQFRHDIKRFGEAHPEYANV